jgi:hypothetical protein
VYARRQPELEPTVKWFGPKRCDRLFVVVTDDGEGSFQPIRSPHAPTSRSAARSTRSSRSSRGAAYLASDRLTAMLDSRRRGSRAVKGDAL